MIKIFFFILCLILCNTAHSQDMDSLISNMTSKSLPIVCVSFDSERINREVFIPGNITIHEPPLGYAGGGISNYRCMFRIRGNSSASDIYPKKCYAVKLVDDKGNDLDANLFGIRKENSWILDAMANDRLRMRNRLLFDIWNDISKTPYDTDYENRNGTKGQYVELFVNGNYNGIYCLSDKIDRKLLGLKKAKIDGNTVKIRGLLYKGVRWDDASYTLAKYDDENVDTISWNAWELKYPEDYPSYKTWEPLINLIDFCGGDSIYFRNHYKEFFYEDNLLDYMIICYAFNIYDMPYKNTYLSIVNLEKDKKFLYTPWDLDASMGMDWNGHYINEYNFYFNAVEPNDTLKYTAQTKFRKLMPFNQLYNDNINGFKDKFIRKMTHLMSTILSVDSVADRIITYSNLFNDSGSWAREVAKWGKGFYHNLDIDMTKDIEYALDWYAFNLDSIKQWLQTTNSIENKYLNKGNIESYDLRGYKTTKTNFSRSIIKKKHNNEFLEIKF